MAKELLERDELERSRKSKELVEARIPDASFNLLEVGAVEPGDLAQRVVRSTTVNTEFADSDSQNRAIALNTCSEKRLKTRCRRDRARLPTHS